jgi:F-type H+-transporting ATPase subunit epsilon
MATFHFDLVSPEKILFSGEVEQVDVPGSEGDFGVLAGHAPLVSIVRPGILTVRVDGKEEKIVVFGGFAEVSAKGLTVLADVAAPAEEVDQDTLAAHIKKVQEKIDTMPEGSSLDKEIWRLDHFKTVQQNLHGTAMH